MFKPTKKQHVVNKAYADKNGGSGGGSTEPLIVNISSSGGGDLPEETLDRTWQEIHDAFPNVILRLVSSGSIGGESEKFFSVINVRKQGGIKGTTYIVDSLVNTTSGFNSYKTGDPNGYPNNA